MIEYARQKVTQLQKTGYFDVLTSEEVPTEVDKNAVRIAFEFGFAAAEHRMMVNYGDYVYDGIAMSEWRDAGLPKAREERLRRTRAEILQAAQRKIGRTWTSLDKALVRKRDSNYAFNSLIYENL